MEDLGGCSQGESYVNAAVLMWWMWDTKANFIHKVALTSWLQLRKYVTRLRDVCTTTRTIWRGVKRRRERRWRSTRSYWDNWRLNTTILWGWWGDTRKNRSVTLVISCSVQFLLHPSCDTQQYWYELMTVCAMTHHRCSYQLSESSMRRWRGRWRMNTVR